MVQGVDVERNGNSVKRSTLIARMGSMGRSTGDHVHYEVFFADEPVDPTMFVESISYKIAIKCFLCDKRNTFPMIRVRILFRRILMVGSPSIRHCVVDGGLFFVQKLPRINGGYYEKMAQNTPDIHRNLDPGCFCLSWLDLVL